MMNPGNWKALPSNPDDVKILMDAVNQVVERMHGEPMPACATSLPLPYNGTGIWAVQVAPKLLVVVKPTATRTTEYAKTSLGTPDYTQPVEVPRVIYAMFEQQRTLTLVWGPAVKNPLASIQDLVDAATRRGARPRLWAPPDESGNIRVQMTKKQALDLRILVCRCGHDPRDHYTPPGGARVCAYCTCASLEIVARHDMKVLEMKEIEWSAI